MSCAHGMRFMLRALDCWYSITGPTFHFRQLRFGDISYFADFAFELEHDLTVICFTSQNLQLNAVAQDFDDWLNRPVAFRNVSDERRLLHNLSCCALASQNRNRGELGRIVRFPIDEFTCDLVLDCVWR